MKALKSFLSALVIATVIVLALNFFYTSQRAGTGRYYSQVDLLDEVSEVTLMTSSISPSSHVQTSNHSRPTTLLTEAVYRSSVQPPSTESTDALPRRNDYEASNTVDNYPTEGTRRGGYVAAVSFMDQQTSALGRILSLQCWAAGFGGRMYVVEPFMLQSSPGLPLVDARQLKGQPRFRDIFDIQHWRDSIVTPRGFAPFASWEEFLSNAPRNILLVAFGFSYALVEGFPYSGRCPAVLQKFETHSSHFFHQYGFRVVSRACISWKRGELFTDTQFRKLVLAQTGLSIYNLTVVFSEWRGIGMKDEIIRISDSECRHYKLRLKSINSTRPSTNVTDDALQYIQHLGNRDFITVMIRMEWVLLRGVDPMKCLNEALKPWKEIRKTANAKDTVVLADIGQYGSLSLQHSKHYSKVMTSFMNFLRIVSANNSLTLEDWEDGYARAARWTTPGYVALMQAEVAVRAKCIILVGGGGFQVHALKRYKELHQSESYCYRLLPKCGVPQGAGHG